MEVKLHHVRVIQRSLISAWDMHKSNESYCNKGIIIFLKVNLYLLLVYIKTNTNKSIYLQFDNKEKYSNKELDKIREELVEYVVKYLP